MVAINLVLWQRVSVYVYGICQACVCMEVETEKKVKWSVSFTLLYDLCNSNYHSNSVR